MGEAGAFTSSKGGKRIWHQFIMKLIHSAITHVHNFIFFLQHLNLTSHLCHWTETRAFGENKLKRERPQPADAGWLKHVTLLLWGTCANHCTTTSNLHEIWLSNDREWSLVSCNLINCWFLHKKRKAILNSRMNNQYLPWGFGCLSVCLRSLVWHLV